MLYAQIVKHDLIIKVSHFNLFWTIIILWWTTEFDIKALDILTVKMSRRTIASSWTITMIQCQHKQTRTDNGINIATTLTCWTIYWKQKLATNIKHNYNLHVLTIWVKKISSELHFWRTKWIVCRKSQHSCKHSTFKAGTFWSTIMVQSWFQYQIFF